MLPEGGWIPHAPSLRRKLILLAKVQDEGGHGQYLYHAAETLGAALEEMIPDLLSGKAKYASVFNYSADEWADNATIGALVDGAAILNQTMLARSSYGPYSRTMVRISAEESFHFQQGQEMTILYSQDTPVQQAMIQRAVNRWWWPALMMFGPHDNESKNTAVLTKWGIKTKTNDELHQTFVNQMTAILHPLGLTIPDTKLRYFEETGNWHFGEIDWDEFWRVIKGDGPCNTERLAARRKAHEDGQWVREAMTAYASRQSRSQNGDIH